MFVIKKCQTLCIAALVSFSTAFKTIQINRNFIRSIKVNTPSQIKSESDIYVFHGGLFGKIPTDILFNQKYC